MQFLGMVASFLVGLDCIERAVGIQPQSLFLPDANWLWWLPAVCWVAVSIRFGHRMMKGLPGA